MIDSSGFSVYRVSPSFLQPTLPLVALQPTPTVPTPALPYSLLASLQRLPSPGPAPISLQSLKQPYHCSLI